MKKSLGTLIPLQDYLRVHRVVRSALDMAGAETAHACWFFSVAGAAILRKYYKKDAHPVAGAMCLMVDEENANVLCFATLEGEAIRSSNNAFHALVVCGDYVVDFMSPIFPETCKSSGHPFMAPSKSFQRKIETMASSHTDLSRDGDFFFSPNELLTDHLKKRFVQGHLQSDVLNACLEWFIKPPKPMRPTLTVADEKGQVINVKLKDGSVVGSW